MWHSWSRRLDPSRLEVVQVQVQVQGQVEEDQNVEPTQGSVTLQMANTQAYQ